MSTGGRWLPEETSYHINVLPRTASGLTRFNVPYEKKAKAQELLLMDNISTVTYIDKMGGGGLTPYDIVLSQEYVRLVPHVLVTAQFIP